MTTIPLTLTSTYSNSYLNPYFTSTYYTNNNFLYKSVVSNPIKTFISPLGVATHDDPVVYHYKYHQYTPPLKQNISKITVSSPLLSPSIMSPIYTPSVGYPDLNYDHTLRRKMTAYFYERTMNDWLYSDFSQLLQYLIVKGEKVSVVSNKSQLEKNKTNQNSEKKVDFIADNVMTKYDLKSFLKKLVNKSGINWYDLKQNKSYVKRAIYKKIKNNLKTMMIH